jgi:hypothetical protein
VGLSINSAVMTLTHVSDNSSPSDQFINADCSELFDPFLDFSRTFDFGDDDNLYDPLANLSAQLVESGIDSWARECLPGTDYPSPSETTPISSLDEDEPQDSDATLCYGTVISNYYSSNAVFTYLNCF